MFEKTVKEWSNESDSQSSDPWIKKNKCVSCLKSFTKLESELYCVSGGNFLTFQPGASKPEACNITMTLRSPNCYVLYFCKECFGYVAGEYWLMNSKEVF